MATARSIIYAAMRKLGVLAAGEVPQADEAADSLLALNAMLASWSTTKLLVPRITQVEATVSGATYTLTSRPMRVLDSTVLNGGQAYAVASLSRADWFAISNPSQSGRPSALWWDEAMAPLVVRFWPIPDKAYTVTLQRWDPLGSFASLETVMDLPAEYERAIIFNLAVELASEFGAQISADVASVANVSLNALVKYHAQETPTMTTDLVGTIGRRYVDWRAF